MDALVFDLGSQYSYRITSSDRQIRVLGLAGPEPPLHDEHAWENAISLIDICENLISITAAHKVAISEPAIKEEQLWKELLPSAHSIMAKSYLECLRRMDVIASCQVDNWRTPEEFAEAQRALAFKWYAQKHWHSHVVASKDPNLDEMVVNYLRRITEDPVCWMERQQSMVRSKTHESLVEDNETAIIKAARLGMNRILEKLLLTILDNISDLQDMDDIVNIVSSEEHTALSIAVEHGHTSTVQLLYRYGGDIHRRNRLGYGLLHIAAEKDDGVMVMLLLCFGSEPNTLDRNYWTPLHVAAQNNSVNAAKVLLDNDADINATDLYGRNAMFIAAVAGQLELVKMLVGWGVDLSTSRRPFS